MRPGNKNPLPQDIFTRGIRTSSNAPRSLKHLIISVFITICLIFEQCDALSANDRSSIYPRNAFLVMKTRVKVGNRRTLKCDPGEQGHFIRWERENNVVVPENDIASGYQIVSLYGPKRNLTDGSALILTARRSHAGKYYCILDYGRIHYLVEVVEKENEELMYYFAVEAEAFDLTCSDAQRQFHYWKKDGLMLNSNAAPHGLRIQQGPHEGRIHFEKMRNSDSGTYQCEFNGNYQQNIHINVVRKEHLNFVDLEYKPPADLVAGIGLYNKHDLDQRSSNIKSAAKRRDSNTVFLLSFVLALIFSPVCLNLRPVI